MSLRTEDDLSSDEEKVVHAIVRERLKQASEFCRETLMASRGGLQHLTPNQVAAFGASVGSLDLLIRALSE